MCPCKRGPLLRERGHGEEQSISYVEVPMAKKTTYTPQSSGLSLYQWKKMSGEGVLGERIWRGQGPLNISWPLEPPT